MEEAQVWGRKIGVVCQKIGWVAEQEEGDMKENRECARSWSNPALCDGRKMRGRKGLDRRSF